MDGATWWLGGTMAPPKILKPPLKFEKTIYFFRFGPPYFLENTPHVVENLDF